MHSQTIKARVVGIAVIAKNFELNELEGISSSAAQVERLRTVVAVDSVGSLQQTSA